MKRKIPAQSIYLGDYDWHKGRFHFPFADYVDPNNSPFGVLQALNDFELDPGTGFDSHPHEEMEIISYCVEGSLNHKDNMGNNNTIRRGDVQYLCAGSGVTHSEMNSASEGILRFLQIWITPNKRGLSPHYRTRRSLNNAGKNELTLVVSGKALESAIKIQQDANIYIAELSEQKQVTISNREERQSYVFCLEGNMAGNGVDLDSRDSLKLWGKECLTLTTLEDSHIMIVEMAMED